MEELATTEGEVGAGSRDDATVGQADIGREVEIGGSDTNGSEPVRRPQGYESRCYATPNTTSKWRDPDEEKKPGGCEAH